MKEQRALAFLSVFSIFLFVVHFALGKVFNSIYLKFFIYSYLLMYSISLLEILSLRVRYTSYSHMVPYVVLGMSVIKMLLSILWIFFAIGNGWVNTSAVMIHFFAPYFLMLALTSWLMIRMMR